MTSTLPRIVAGPQHVPCLDGSGGAIQRALGTQTNVSDVGQLGEVQARCAWPAVVGRFTRSTSLLSSKSVFRSLFEGRPNASWQSI